ncbi:MAG TPA: class I SAM-dependent methyltransferase [Candidatus Dormibacteraeota bacterium]|nr:class I SAM-dependent methyltransferase [Candidatus Dormibacteraeota bacterium]
MSVGEPAAASAANAFAADLFRGLPKRYDLLAEILSFRQNARWRRGLVTRIAQSNPSRVLDVATGTAGVAIALATQTSANVTGTDISEAMLERGRLRVTAERLTDRVRLEPGRAEELPFTSASFDAVSFTYLLRYVDDPAATMTELARVLRPGGVMASLDFFVPPNPAWHAAWWFYTRLVLPAAGLLFGGPVWWRVGRFLGPNISSHYVRWPLQRIVAAWTQAGMVDVEYRVMSVGGGLVMWGRKTT